MRFPLCEVEVVMKIVWRSILIMKIRWLECSSTAADIVSVCDASIIKIYSIGEHLQWFQVFSAPIRTRVAESFFGSLYFSLFAQLCRILRLRSSALNHR